MVGSPPMAPLIEDCIQNISEGDQNEGQHHHAQHSTNPVGTIDVGYLGEHSLLSNHPPSMADAGVSLGSFGKPLEKQCFQATEADRLPPQSAIDASVAVYFQFLYHRVPVIDHQDLECNRPSTLLLQTLCFIGSFLRHPKSSRTLQQTELLYTRAKILFFLNHENEPLALLKALCFFTLWNVRVPSVVTLDCSWNWLGLATRLATQMGLHRESTHSRLSNPSCSRRIAWYVYSMDKMLSSCFGRPPMLRTDEFDVQPLTVADFDPTTHDQARCFIIYTELAQISAKMLDLQRRETTSATAEVLSVLADLRAWALNIPTKFVICDRRGRMIYHLALYEFLACYLTQILTYFHIFGKHFQPSVASRISLVASSCVIAIYQEIDYRDHMNYLTAINNWSMMAASVAQLNNISRESQVVSAEAVASGDPCGRSSSLQELDALIDIIKQRRVKFPGARAIVHRVEQLRQEVLSPRQQNNDSSQPSSARASIRPYPQSESRLMTASGALAPVSNVREFFPFPKSLTPRLELLDAIEEESLAETFFNNSPDWFDTENLFGFDDINLSELDVI
ncbi:Fungal specific transcription factor domain-containing protein [Cladophialophora immunda]|nr:Fungal specific transcription factor domain-containing protein [Cladophialophora immunda]